MKTASGQLYSARTLVRTKQPYRIVTINFGQTDTPEQEIKPSSETLESIKKVRFWKDGRDAFRGISIGVLGLLAVTVGTAASWRPLSNWTAWGGKVGEIHEALHNAKDRANATECKNPASGSKVDCAHRRLDFYRAVAQNTLAAFVNKVKYNDEEFQFSIPYWEGYEIPPEKLVQIDKLIQEGKIDLTDEKAVFDKVLETLYMPESRQNQAFKQERDHWKNNGWGMSEMTMTFYPYEEARKLGHRFLEQSAAYLDTNTYAVQKTINNNYAEIDQTLEQATRFILKYGIQYFLLAMAALAFTQRRYTRATESFGKELVGDQFRAELGMTREEFLHRWRTAAAKMQEKIAKGGQDSLPDSVLRKVGQTLEFQRTQGKP